MVTQLEIQQKVQIGEDLLAAYIQGAMSQQLGIPGGAALQADAVAIWGRIFPAPISEGWAAPAGVLASGAGSNLSSRRLRASEAWGGGYGKKECGYLPESGQGGPLASIWRLFAKKAGQAAQAAKGKVGPTLKLIAGVTVPTVLAYGGYVWLTEGDRADMRRVNMSRDLQEKAMQIKDPEAQRRALDAIIRGAPGRPITGLGWVAIIGGIAVVGLFLWTRRPKR